MRLHLQPHRRGDGGDTCTRCCFTVRHPTGMRSSGSSLRGRRVRAASYSHVQTARVVPGASLLRSGLQDLRPAAAPRCSAPPGAHRSPFFSQATARLTRSHRECFHARLTQWSRQTDRKAGRAPGQRILSSCRSIPAICRNLSFLRCFSAIRARAVSSGSWV